MGALLKGEKRYEGTYNYWDQNYQYNHIIISSYFMLHIPMIRGIVLLQKYCFALKVKARKYYTTVCTTSMIQSTTTPGNNPIRTDNIVRIMIGTVIHRAGSRFLRCA